MSKSSVVTSQGSLRQENDSVSVLISQDIVLQLTSIAVSRQIEVNSLVNQILEQYITSQSLSRQEQSGVGFLLSIAGMFNSGTNDTSENVNAIVTDFVLQKWEQSSP